MGTTGSELFSYQTYLHTRTFILLSIFYLLRRLVWKSGTDQCPDMRNVHFRSLSVTQKCHNYLFMSLTEKRSPSATSSIVSLQTSLFKDINTLQWNKFVIKDIYSSKLWSSQLWTQFKQLRIGPWKGQDFHGVWTRDLAIPVRRSNQLSYEATDVGSWSSVGSNKPVRNECELIYEIFHTSIHTYIYYNNIKNS